MYVCGGTHIEGKEQGGIVGAKPWRIPPLEKLRHREHPCVPPSLNLTPSFLIFILNPLVFNFQTSPSLNLIPSFLILKILARVELEPLAPR